MCVRSCVRVCVCVSFIECFMSFVLIWIILSTLFDCWEIMRRILEGEKPPIRYGKITGILKQSNQHRNMTKTKHV